MDFKRLLSTFISFISFINLAATDRDFSIEIERLTLSPQNDASWVDKCTLRTTKIGKNNYAVNGGLDIMKNIGNDLQSKLAIYQKDKISGKFSVSPVYMLSSTPCKVYDESNFVDGIIAASNLPPKGTCPFPKGHYDFKNYTLTQDDFPKSLPAGDYKIVLTILKDSNILAQFELYVNVIKD